MNALNKGTESNNTISIASLNAMDKNDKTSIREPDYQFYVSYDFYPKDNPHFHREGLYGFYQGNYVLFYVLIQCVNLESRNKMIYKCFPFFL